MQLGCTKKLLDYLGKKGGPADTDIEPLLSWSAHLITLNHRHTVVAANDSSRYGFVLYGLKAKDVKSFAVSCWMASVPVWRLRVLRRN